MSQASTEMARPPSNPDRRYAAAALLLEKWMLEDSGYDDRVWPKLEEELNRGGMQCRDADELGA